MPELRNVAVAGGTGRLGHHVVQSLLSPQFRSNFRDIVLLTRDRNEVAVKLESEGATIRLYNEDNMVESLKDIDILVNTLASKGHHYKLKIVEALPKSSVKLYFPSEFGVDHYKNTFKQDQWDTKRAMYETVKNEALSVQMCLVFIGLVMELSIGPWFGYDTRSGRYTCVGPATVPSSYTSMADAGKIVAALATLPYSKIPPSTHFGGDIISCGEIARIMKANGGPEITVEELDLKEFREKVLEQNALMPADHIRFLMGEGKIDHRTDALGSDADLVNEGEKNWKWKTMEDYAREVQGKPFM